VVQLQIPEIPRKMNYSINGQRVIGSVEQWSADVRDEGKRESRDGGTTVHFRAEQQSGGTTVLQSHH
jgi:hypothetical protein